MFENSYELPLALEQVASSMHAILSDTMALSKGREYEVKDADGKSKVKRVPPELRLVQNRRDLGG